MASFSSGYVSISRCPEIFDGTNFGEFVAFMHMHMRGLSLWGVLSGEVVAKEAAKATEDMINRYMTILLLLVPIVMI